MDFKNWKSYKSDKLDFNVSLQLDTEMRIGQTRRTTADIENSPEPQIQVGQQVNNAERVEQIRPPVQDIEVPRP